MPDYPKRLVWKHIDHPDAQDYAYEHIVDEEFWVRVKNWYYKNAAMWWGPPSKTLTVPDGYGPGQRQTANGFAPPLTPADIKRLQDSIRAAGGMQAAAKAWNVHPSALQSAIHSCELTPVMRHRIWEILHG